MADDKPAPLAAELVPARRPPSDLEAQRTAIIRRVDERLRRKSTRIMEAVADGANIDDEGKPVDPATVVDPVTGKPLGWSHARYRIARDARKPLKYQPGYLPLMARVHESYRKAERDVDPAPALGPAVNVFVNSLTYNYPVRDVSDPDPGAKK